MFEAKQSTQCHRRSFVVMAPVSRVVVCSHLVSSSGIIDNVRTIRVEAPQIVYNLLTSCKYCFVVLFIFYVRICNTVIFHVPRYVVIVNTIIFCSKAIHDTTLVLNNNVFFSKHINHCVSNIVIVAGCSVVPARQTNYHCHVVGREH